MLESVLLVRNLLGQFALMNKALLVSKVDWFAILELTKCLKSVCDMTTAIEQKKLTADEFFEEWLKYKIQLQCKSVHNASYLAMATLHAMKRRETTLLSKVSGTSTIFSENGCTGPFSSIWRCLQMLQKSVDMTDVECLDSSSKSANGSTPACKVDIIDEILATLGACSVRSSQSP